MIVGMSRTRKLLPGIFLLTAILAACSLPRATPAATRPPEIPGVETVVPPATSTPRGELGTDSNPILLALPPSQFPDPVTVNNGQTLATRLEEQTGLRIVAVAPTTHSELIEALRIGNAHIAVLPPFVIVEAYRREAVQAAYASTEEESASIGTQFVALRSRFTAYYDPVSGINTADAQQALAQFSGKKPCWTETDSLSGHLVPAGMLGWYKIHTEAGAFLQSHFSVVRAVRMGEICDFGATYIDARTYPALKDEYPYIMDEVAVIWQAPPIIPYDGIFLSKIVPPAIKAQLVEALDLVFVSDGALFEALFGIKGILPVEDIFYTEFTRYIQASGEDWQGLVR